MGQLTELMQQRAQLDQQIAEIARAERQNALNQIRDIAREHGLTGVDLARLGAQSPMKSTGPRTAVAPKFRDPKTGATWSGRGKRPNWLVSGLRSGNSIDTYRIGDAPAAQAEPPPKPARKVAKAVKAVKKAPAKKAKR